MYTRVAKQCQGDVFTCARLKRGNTCGARYDVSAATKEEEEEEETATAEEES